MKDTARFLAHYAKQYSAGAFATPMASELEQRPYDVRDWRDGDHRVVAVTKQLSRDSKRTDYIGRQYVLPAGALIVTHLATTPGSPLPDLSGFSYVYAYIEDSNVTANLAVQRREVSAVTVNAASQIIGCWGQPGTGFQYDPVDRATFVQLPKMDIPVDNMRSEVEALSGWFDDFPYYSDGSWSALSVRGYKADDPQWGVKPSEMPKKWQEEHPEAMHLRLGWTSLAERVPTVRDWVDDFSKRWDVTLERVRLFRMEAKPKQDGKLGRHSDIQDKAVGTRDRQLARLHVPIITHPQVTMTCWNFKGREATHHLAAGDIYYLDTRKPHAVHNYSPISRVHLVIDLEVNKNVRDAIRQGTDLAA